MNTNFCCETSNETQLLARIWNERLGKLIKKNFGTQKEFAQKFKAETKTSVLFVFEEFRLSI